MFRDLTESEHQDLMAKAFSTDDPIAIGVGVASPKIKLGIVIGFIGRKKDEESGKWRRDYSPNTPCAFCGEDLGAIHGSCRAINLSLGHKKVYQVGFICAKHKDEPDLAEKTKALFIKTLSSLLAEIEKLDFATVPVDKP